MVVNSTATTIGNTDLGQIGNYLSWLPRTLTKATTDFLVSNNIQVTERWVSGLLILFSLCLIYISIKLLEKANWIVKALIIILAILLLLGLYLVPGW